MNEYCALVLGVVCAGVGGELFVRGAVGLASWARVSPGIIGVTVAAFATSSPELSVAVNAALAGKPQITLGDALGSNVVNIALILALALVISGIKSPRDSIKRDFPVALLIPLITGVLCLDGELSRFDGVMMLGMFFIWLAAVIIEVRSQRSTVVKVLGAQRGWLTVLSCVAGLAALAAAGNLIVAGARGIAISFGLDEFVIGATIVAVGTSMPELATTLIAKFRGHDDVGLGTILGSNIYNGIFIIAVAAIITPIPVVWREVATALAFGFAALALTYPARDGFIGRRRGVSLLALYAVYLTFILKHRAGSGLG
ncbi:MAG: sodium:calcium antiporter [Elusimicrobia bacterium GWC2_61_19]|nr:MAG: sodium:calcium antiporter [Elusimicrobia bacterium GWC2_61_19]